SANHGIANWLSDVHASRVYKNSAGDCKDAREGEENWLRRRPDVRPRADRREGAGEDSSKRRPHVCRDARAACAHEGRAAEAERRASGGMRREGDRASALRPVEGQWQQNRSLTVDGRGRRGQSELAGNLARV